MIKFIKKYFRRRKERRLEQERLRREQKRKFLLELHYQCVRNARKLRAQINTVQSLASNAKGETSGETRKIRQKWKDRLTWIESKILEEEFYVEHYLNLSKS